MSIRATVQTPAGVGEIRDLEGLDIESIVRYWHTSTKDHLDFLGVDLGRLGTERQTYDRFLVALPLGDPNQKTLGFSIYLDGAFAGYTLLNRYTPLDNYSHWHITNPALRRSGLSTALYPHRIKTYFDYVPIERLIHQTRTRNVGVNRMLDKYVPIAETLYVEHPDGVALPGEFNIRYVYREDVPRLFGKSQG